jgi:hypothetical protein
MPGSVYDSGWSEVAPWVRYGGQWREVEGAWVMDGGQWRQWFEPADALLRLNSDPRRLFHFDVKEEGSLELVSTVVNSWADKSGNGNQMVPSGGSSVTYSSSAEGVLIDPNRRLSLVDLDFEGVQGPITAMMMVFTMTTTLTGNRSLALVRRTTGSIFGQFNSVRFFVSRDSSPLSEYSVGGSYHTDPDSPGLGSVNSPNRPAIVGATFVVSSFKDPASGDFILFFNGQEANRAPSPASLFTAAGAVDSVSLPSNSSSNQTPSTGYCHEFVCFTGNVVVKDMTAYHGALMEKWSIS